VIGRVGVAEVNSVAIALALPDGHVTRADP